MSPAVTTARVTTGVPSTDAGTPTLVCDSGCTSPRVTSVADNTRNSTGTVIHDATGSAARAAAWSGDWLCDPTHHAPPEVTISTPKAPTQASRRHQDRGGPTGASFATGSSWTGSSTPVWVLSRRRCFVSSIGSANSVIVGSRVLVHVQDVVVFFLGADTSGVRIGEHLACGVAALSVPAPTVARPAQHPRSPLLWCSFCHHSPTEDSVLLLCHMCPADRPSLRGSADNTEERALSQPDSIDDADAFDSGDDGD